MAQTSQGKDKSPVSTQPVAADPDDWLAQHYIDHPDPVVNAEHPAQILGEPVAPVLKKKRTYSFSDVAATAILSGLVVLSASYLYGRLTQKGLSPVTAQVVPYTSNVAPVKDFVTAAELAEMKKNDEEKPSTPVAQVYWPVRQDRSLACNGREVVCFSGNTSDPAKEIAKISTGLPVAKEGTYSIHLTVVSEQ